MVERRLIAVEGTVQGVGFRPYVHRLAWANKLRGRVRNGGGGVLIDVEGEAHDVDAFCDALTYAPPPLAAISRVRVERAPLLAYDGFLIGDSELLASTPAKPLVPPDIATCDACLSELFDPSNRRFGHPFITCTDCGPRFTIIRDTPYDRARTMMAAFAMCADCHREYHDPANRRFHAEAIACWSCGPTLRAAATISAHHSPAGQDPVAAAVVALRDGNIVALKALGGFHLACDATNGVAVARLRARKHRVAKPLAVMVRDADAADALCVVSVTERSLLESPARPIVLVDRRPDADVADAIAPGQQTLGVMLPSTPLHHLLLRAVDGPLVMTSGNRSGEPVVTDERSAVAALGGIADLFLWHDRAIGARCDDSVVHVVSGAARTVRRARGYASRAIPLALPTPQPVLALGGHLKNTICLATGQQAMLSPHIGALDSVESRQALRDAVTWTIRAARIAPTVIAHDLHPEYGSTHAADELAADLEIRHRVAVQHHHAHVAACVAEHGETGPVIGVAFDGAGLGSDGAIWGGEFMCVNGATFERYGHLAYVPLPGGDAAARRPWRSAYVHLAASGFEMARPDAVDPVEWRALGQVMSHAEQLPRTSSVGRLFDAVASVLGLCHVSRFEGEAAMTVEAAADPLADRGYATPIDNGATWTVDASSIVRAVADDRRRGISVCEVAGSFHRALGDVIVAGCERIREATGTSVVAFGGGVFVNALLLSLSTAKLTERGFRVRVPRDVPCNDGGLSLGQAYVAARALEEDTPCA
jgi:hydrogenase maturation protein HypF